MFHGKHSAKFFKKFMFHVKHETHLNNIKRLNFNKNCCWFVDRKYLFTLGIVDKIKETQPNLTQNLNKKTPKNHAYHKNIHAISTTHCGIVDKK